MLNRLAMLRQAARHAALRGAPTTRAPAAGMASQSAAQREEFDRLLRESPVGRLGGDARGAIVKGRVTTVFPNRLLVDIGSKFPALVRLDGTGFAFELGQEVTVVVKDLERTAHFLGDDKHTSTHLARAELVKDE